MSNIDKKRLAQAMVRLDKLTAALPGQRREAVQRLGNLAEGAVLSSIRARVRDSRGKVQSWQQKRLGSGGGYAAVSPARRSAPPHYPATGPDSPGAVTNYLEHGWLHRSGRRAAPRRMYWQAEAQLTHRTENEAQRLAQRIVRGLKDD